MWLTSSRKQCFQSCMLSAVSSLLGYLWLKRCFHRKPSSPREAKKRPQIERRAASSGMRWTNISTNNRCGTRQNALAVLSSGDWNAAHSPEDATVEASNASSVTESSHSSAKSAAELGRSATRFSARSRARRALRFCVPLRSIGDIGFLMPQEARWNDFCGSTTHAEATTDAPHAPACFFWRSVLPRRRPTWHHPSFSSSVILPFSAGRRLWSCATLRGASDVASATMDTSWTEAEHGRPDDDRAEGLGRQELIGRATKTFEFAARISSTVGNLGFTQPGRCPQGQAYACANLKACSKVISLKTAARSSKRTLWSCSSTLPMQ
mmetsp:Transcript_120521/g.257331  ORF Transcript_120521/g.257331 Transcript_120521/m.257331 type:complete len:323 (+) Transcript_120521:1208-2176(+)